MVKKVLNRRVLSIFYEIFNKKFITMKGGRSGSRSSSITIINADDSRVVCQKCPGVLSLRQPTYLYRSELKNLDLGRRETFGGSPNPIFQFTSVIEMLGAGLEPARYRYQGILSP